MIKVLMSVISSMVLLSGCSSLMPVKTVYVPVEIKANIDTRLLLPCKDVSHLPSPTTEEELVVWVGDTMIKYSECKRKLNDLIRVIN
jgi:hypothetical protein